VIVKVGPPKPKTKGKPKTGGAATGASGDKAGAGNTTTTPGGADQPPTQ
jgi:hypothetical protein